MTHTPLTSLSVEDMAHELRRSRDVIEHELGSPIDAIAYPHGHYDSDVERLAGDSGYVFGLTCVPGHARRTDRPLALPRQEIRGSTTFDEFVALVRG
jgi:peptidoglycan/xylan/chitin deacetylase (PgdA/CDA1 family)